MDEGKGYVFYDYAKYMLTTVSSDSAYTGLYGVNGGTAYDWVSIGTANNPPITSLVLCMTPYIYDSNTATCRRKLPKLLHLNPSTAGFANYVTYSYASPFPTADNTIELWILPLALPSGSANIFLYSRDSVASISFDSANINIKDGSQSSIAATITAGAWTHLSVTFPHTGLANNQIFINRDLFSCLCNPIGTFATSGNIYIGSDNTGNNVFNGFIRDFRYWNYARDNFEILRDTMRLVLHSDKIMMNYMFNEGIGKTYYDSGVYGRHMIFTARPLVFPWEYSPVELPLCEGGGYFNGDECKCKIFTKFFKNNK